MEIVLGSENDIQMFAKATGARHAAEAPFRPQRVVDLLIAA